MTKQQKAEIESLHKEGISYRRIAEKIGVSVSCIKSYFYRKQKRDTVLLCEQCHKPIITSVIRSNRRFCSLECKSRWWYLQRTGHSCLAEAYPVWRRHNYPDHLQRRCRAERDRQRYRPGLGGAGMHEPGRRHDPE